MKNKKIYYFILTFIIPILIFLMIIYIKTGTIDGEYIMFSDMGAQYSVLFKYLKNILDGTESLFYSFHKGFGGEMFATFTYYLSSPLNLLLYFFSNDNILNGILFIILLKIGLSGLTMNIYLTSRNNKKMSANLVFSICYALMGYVVNYYFNIMWLDSVYMLPLVILGVDRLINKNKPLMYIVTLSYTLIANYYTGYMICLFVLLYYIYQMIIKGDKEKRTFIMFLISTILSVGIASFILIPTLIQIPNFVTNGVDINFNFERIIDLFKGILSNSIIGGHSCSELKNEFGTYSYITMFCFILICMYFLNKKISSKKKKLSMLMLFVFLLSTILDPLIFIWHGFSFPNAFNNRESFIFCFFLILLAHDSYVNLEKLNKKQFMIIAFILTIYHLICFIFLESEFYLNIILNMLISIIYILLFNNVLISKKYIFKILLIILVVVEIYLNATLTFVSKTKITLERNDYENKICSIFDNANKNYRGENLAAIVPLDSLLCQYRGSSAFISTLVKEDVAFYETYGYFGYNKMMYAGTGNSNLFSGLLGLKYYLLDEESNKIKSLEKTDKCENIAIFNEEKRKYCLYENSSALSLGYVVDDIKINSGNNVFENQNKLFKTMFSLSENYWQKLESTITYKNKLQLIVKNNTRPFYVYFDVSPVFEDFNEMEIYINGIKYFKEEDSPSLAKRILEFNSDNEETLIELYVNENSKINDILVYQENEMFIDEYNEYIEKNLNQLNIETFGNDRLSGTIEVGSNGYLLLTIPYDNNFDIYIDNKKVNTEKAYNYFMSTKIEPGKHNIKLIYNKKNYYYAGIISIISIVISSIFVKKCKK